MSKELEMSNRPREVRKIKRIDKRYLLTDKQEKFCLEFLRTHDPRQAALNAGYNPQAVDHYVSQLMKFPRVRKYIDDAFEHEYGIKRQTFRAEMIQQLEYIAKAHTREVLNPDGTVKPPSEWSEQGSAAVSEYSVLETPNGLLTRVKFKDNFKAIMLACKLLDTSPVSPPPPTFPQSQEEIPTLKGQNLDQIDDRIMSGISSAMQIKIMRQEKGREQVEKHNISKAENELLAKKEHLVQELQSEQPVEIGPKDDYGLLSSEELGYEEEPDDLPHNPYSSAPLTESEESLVTSRLLRDVGYKKVAGEMAKLDYDAKVLSKQSKS